ncbi:MAG: hypothetical protein BWY95_02458 [Bacteroidetes bacterium ADurb.BinA104]|nr:MAG: hypothetical protein BWY95_02458 [Bacteroidetes bacterium ADurb.BinA104]
MIKLIYSNKGTRSIIPIKHRLINEIPPPSCRNFGFFRCLNIPRSHFCNCCIEIVFNRRGPNIPTVFGTDYPVTNFKVTKICVCINNFTRYSISVTGLISVKLTPYCQ